ncbi:hypothetical protein [Jiangella muralis]|uniref:hypothetical protein n=1 Tax=Jiangella muralis TaxID=702383 RepID=UPI00069F433E|nr:hypothetical protein [Jiangella muralis]
MAKSQIIVEEFRNVVTGVENGKERLSDAKLGLTNALTKYEIDHELGNQVQNAIDWADTELPGLRRRLSLAEALENSNPEWPAGTVEIDESKISKVSPEEAKQNGEEAAQALLDSPGEITPELAAEIEANMNDPYFAAGFANSASPEQLAAALDTVDAFVEGTYLPQDLRDRMVTAIGTTMGTATRNTGDLAMPQDYADQWSAAITAKAQMEGGDAPQNQAQYLALLMSQGVYSRPFLNQVGDDLYEYEAEGENGAVWGPKSANMDEVMDTNGRPVVDVMATFMVSLSNNPLAAQDFFTQGGTEEMEINGQKVQVNSRLQYLTQERHWGDADASNGGDLGLALEAATTTYRDAEETGADSAVIASQTIALLGEETRTNDGWKMYHGMRGSIANILGAYGPDVMRIAMNGDRDTNFSEWVTDPETQHYGDGAPYGAAFDPALVTELLNTYGEDGNEEHLNTVLTGIAAASQMRFGDALQDALDDGTPPPSPVAMLQGGEVPELNGAIQESATAVGWVLNAAYDGALSEEEAEAKAAEIRSQIFGAVTSLPGVGPATEGWKFVYDQATTLMGDQLGKTDATASDDFGTLSATERDNLEQMILNQMLANGYFDEQYITEANGGPDGTRYAGPPPEALVPGSDPPQFDFSSDAYQEWKREKPPLSQFLESNLFGPYERALEDGFPLGGGG